MRRKALIRAHFVGVEGFVAEKCAANDAVHELFNEIDVVTLAGDQHEFDEIAQSIDERANLCRQAASGSADGLSLRPPFAPAPC